MSKDPAVLFYTSDFLSETYTMTNEQVGMYIRLLCNQHQKGKLTEKDMKFICPSMDEDVWGKFELIDGFYVNKRMQEESERRKNFTESRKKNLTKKKHMDPHMGSHMENHMETGTETITKANIKKEIEIPFSEFFVPHWKNWKEYKSKEHKFNYKSEHSEKAALNELFKLSNGNEQTAIAIINQSVTNGWKGFFGLKNQTNVKKSSGAYQLLEQLKSEYMGEAGSI